MAEGELRHSLRRDPTGGYRVSSTVEFDPSDFSVSLKPCQSRPKSFAIRAAAAVESPPRTSSACFVAAL